MATLTSAKGILRKEIKDILKNISSEEKREQSANVFRKVSLYKSIICLNLLKRLCSDKTACIKGNCNVYNVHNVIKLLSHYFTALRLKTISR